MGRLHAQVLDDGELARIEETAYRILDEVGIAVEHERAVELLQGGGGRVANGRVRLAEDVVRAAIGRLNREARFCSADGRTVVSLGRRAPLVHNTGGMPCVIDAVSSARRPALLRDVEESTRLLDALPQIDVVLPMFGPQDVPPALMIPASFASMLRHTRKPMAGAAAESASDVRFMTAMAAACCGGADVFRREPTLSIMVSPVSPLRLTAKVADAIMAVAEAGAQFQALPCPMLGTTAPITIAGALAQQHAEILASFVLASAVRPGLRVLYSSRISAIDLRTAASEWGAPEVAVSAAGATQLAHRAGFACDVYGLCTSAPRIDQQTAFERLSNALIPALAGADILSGVGFTDNGATGSLALATIDDEIMSHIRHALTGIAVDADTLALGLTREVVADGGTFLDREATIDQIARNACWKPGISRPHRSAAGAPAADLLERARQRVDEILRTHQPEALPVPVERELDVILSEARRELCADAD